MPERKVVRMTTHKHVADAVALGGILHRTSFYSRLEYSREKAVAWGLRAINTPEKVFGAVAYEDGEIAGFMGGHVAEHYFCNGLIADDMTLYVRPKSRGSTIALRFIRMFEAWATEQGAELNMLSVATGIKTERTMKLYQRLGYTVTGFIACKDLKEPGNG